jgi:hypothetical protein
VSARCVAELQTSGLPAAEKHGRAGVAGRVLLRQAYGIARNEQFNICDFREVRAAKLGAQIHINYRESF